MTKTFARHDRTENLHRYGDSKLLIVPLDHTVGAGSLLRAHRLREVLHALRVGGADATVLHKGALDHVDPAVFDDLALIVHLSASAHPGTDPDHKVLVTTVEEALRLGADAVSVHVNLGSRTEYQQREDVAQVARACDRWSVPLFAMVYPRGPRVSNPTDPELVRHAAEVAADLGADVVKVPFTGDPVSMSEVAASVDIPVVVAGGPALRAERAVAHAERILSSGVAGLAFGRNVFQADDPASFVHRLHTAVHTDRTLAAPAPCTPALARS
ncbi:2-amino-3,7-dideoxy-D-threo-hept-6-ulosonate synthase [Nocardia amikacinitolerans]|uniref:2-amino-3,7-dideoxy-D-threo-hept-6-ulosonate synthase n=1 Tax=Nocardia amikacinitolerans TaxID=756689 RepID=UPI000830E608|nr:2-amino-3,7-dideoxy-D-threo-hept-6-ulosonate synthase [Nocardia amikacinitolerans]MCP2314922.1 2-amino-3,7-dideoxy-D-threo-hept-6-ulosonate synthase [Nocardia amikacinitolerans]